MGNILNVNTLRAVEKRVDDKTAGYKTYAGLLVLVLGLVGLTDIVTPEEAQTLVRGIAQAFGVLLAAYGRYKAAQRASA